MTKIISISMTDEQKIFLDEHEFIKPSALFQESINKIIDYHKTISMDKDRLQNNIQKLQKHLSLALEFIEINEKMKEFNDFCSKNTDRGQIE